MTDEERRDRWRIAYARQAAADLTAFERLAAAQDCEVAALHSFQMTCEKLCKAFLCRHGDDPGRLQTTHAVVGPQLPRIAIWYAAAVRRPRRRGFDPFLAFVRRLAREIDLLAPAVSGDGRRPDNCEYPWEAGNGVVAPVDTRFAVSGLLRTPAGAATLKIVRLALTDLTRDEVTP